MDLTVKTENKIVLASAVVVVVVLSILRFRYHVPEDQVYDRLPPAAEPLRISTEPWLRGPVEAIARNYELVYGSRVQIEPAVNRSGAFPAGGEADIYLTSHPRILQEAQAAGIIAERFDLAASGGKTIAFGVRAESKLATWALHFCRYASAPDKGLPLFQLDHYHCLEGDPWAERPVIHLVGGSAFEAVSAARLRRFEKREGIDLRLHFAPERQLGSDPASLRRADVVVLKTWELPAGVASEFRKVAAPAGFSVWISSHVRFPMLTRRLLKQLVGLETLAPPQPLEGAVRPPPQ